MNLQVQVVSKTERMEGQNVVADVTFQPFNGQNQDAMYAQGAQVGTPNAPQPQDPNVQQAPQQPTMSLNGGFTLQIRDQQEAARYVVGQTYSINFGVNEGRSSEAPAPKNGGNKTA